MLKIQKNRILIKQIDRVKKYNNDIKFNEVIKYLNNNKKLLGINYYLT